MNRDGKYFAGLLAMVMLLGAGRAFAEPYLAVRYGLKCTTCHVNPTGGGLRSNFGDVFYQTQLPAHPIHGDWGLWTGEVTKWLRVGGDLRYDATYTQTPHVTTTHQIAVQQGRLYGEAEVVPNRLIFYVDGQVTPGTPPVDQEAYAIFWSADHDWYIKGGKMYLPFGFRFEDQEAFVYAVSLTNMYAPDNGLELGWMRDHWDTQLTVSQGNFAGGFPSGSGKEYGLQASYVESAWRLGVAARDDDLSLARRRTFGVFGGVRTGPVEWLAEVDTSERKLDPGVTQVAGLFEADWLISAGNNLKLTLEPFDPDRDMRGDGQSRVSLVYELTPVQFMQIRAGVRDYNGPRGIDAENQTLMFVQLHVFF